MDAPFKARHDLNSALIMQFDEMSKSKENIMFKKNKAQVTELTAPEAQKKGCCISKMCGSAKPQTKEAILGGLTFLSMFGPKKLRPHLQHLLAVIAIVTFVVKAIKPKREDKSA
ncbi:hypothetical protein P792_06255 [Asaia sp. SF2.1]|nr:hypothetical protein P792_06255 [Asaia sp. SF2.1]